MSIKQQLILVMIKKTIEMSRKYIKKTTLSHTNLAEPFSVIFSC